MAKKERNIAIVGTAESIGTAPWDDPEWEIWALGVTVNKPEFKRADLLFDLHDDETLIEWKFWERRAARTVELDTPIYMQRVHEEIPRSMEFPIKQVLENHALKINGKSIGYFTNSIAYLICYAIDQNPARIGLWGVHVATEEEYHYERNSIEVHLVRAMERGIEIILPDTTYLFRSAKLYGYGKLPAMIRKMQSNARGVGEQLAKVKQTVNEGKEHQAYLQGAYDTLRTVLMGNEH